MSLGEFRRKVASERKVAGAVRSLVNTKGPRLECARERHVSIACQSNNDMDIKGNI